MSQASTKAKVKGSGAYNVGGALKSAMQAIPRGTFQAMGGAAGASLGGPIGGLLGGALGKGLSMFSGYGEYIFNDIIHRDGEAIRKPDPNTARRISHSEFITDIKSPGSGFSITNTLTVNPGDDGVLPWFAPIAQRFAKYRFKQLIFEYRSNTSEYSSNAAMGTVILAPNYNPIAPPPGSKTAMESMTGAVSHKPSNSLLCGIECSTRDNGNPERWVRNPSVNTVSQLTDLCDFYVATSGLASVAGTTLGELWVHYTVDLYEPYFSPTQSLGAPGQSALISTAGNNIGSNFGNIGLTGNVATDVTGVGLSSQILTTYSGLPPTTVSYVLSLDTGTAGRLWFGRAGTYSLSCNCTTATAFTSQTGACWNFLLSDTAATLVRRFGNNEAAGTSGVRTEHIITIKQPGTLLTYNYNGVGWGTAPNTATGGAWLTVLS